MSNDERYKELVNILCELLGISKPIDILKLCQVTSEFIRPYEERIKELERQVDSIKTEYNQKLLNKDKAWHDLVNSCAAKRKKLQKENRQLKVQVSELKELLGGTNDKTKH